MSNFITVLVKKCNSVQIINKNHIVRLFKEDETVKLELITGKVLTLEESFTVVANKLYEK